ncbi:MAG: dihydrolipoyl dehydrogenase [Symbiobacteriaceae bacterium]|nr:dihydrolipoyl dehydrogenase [Symbiobacteriaceae bacterium]
MTKLTAEIAVLGGGPAGYVAAMRAAQLGADVVLIEEKALGGVCLNLGCIPTKALLTTARLISDIKNTSKEHGIINELKEIDWETAVSRKDRVVKNQLYGLEQLLDARNIKILAGHGKVVSTNEIVVATAEGEVHVQCRKMILATGSSPRKLPIPGNGLPGVLTSSDILSMRDLPPSLAILGAGVIGLEFATIFSAAGVKVTIIEMEENLLKVEDEEAGRELLKLLKRQGIQFKLGADIQKIEQNGDFLSVSYLLDGKIQSISAQKVLMAVGRKLNSNMFSALPLAVDKDAIVVNDRMETSVPNIYAAGDVIGGKLLAHLAFAEGKIAAENAVGLRRSLDYRAVPLCIYTQPEYASVGLTKTEALKQGINPRIGLFAFRNNGRALTLGEREGFVRVVADESNVIIGAQILGQDASELISEMTLAVTVKVKVEVLAEMIHPHPTLSEALWEACAGIIGKPIHKI